MSLNTAAILLLIFGFICGGFFGFGVAGLTSLIDPANETSGDKPRPIPNRATPSVSTREGVKK